MSDPEYVQDLVHRYIRAFNQRDYDTLMSLYADDPVLEDPVGSEPVRGREKVRAFYESFKDQKSVLRLEGAIRIAGPTAAFSFHVLMGEDAGQIVEVIDTFLFDSAGRIKEMRAFWGPANVHNMPAP